MPKQIILMKKKKVMLIAIARTLKVLAIILLIAMVVTKMILNILIVKFGILYTAGKCGI